MVLRGSKIYPNNSDTQHKKLPVIYKLSSGAIAGAVARTTVAPIDRIKILMQVNFVQANTIKNTSIFQSTRNILRKEGFVGFWKGNGINCFRVMPHTGIQFLSYDMYKNIFFREQEINVKKRLLAGTFAGITAGTATHPIDIIRIRLQTQSNLNTTLGAIKHIYAEGGLRTFYKGYIPAITSLGPFIAINFATFDTLKTNLRESYPEKVASPGEVLAMGAIAGLTAQTICYPLDTIRRRSEIYGTHYSSVFNAISTIIQKEGVVGFYRGMLANSLKVVPNNFIRFFVFERINNFVSE